MTIHKTLIAQILDTIPGTSRTDFKKTCIDAIKRTQGRMWDREEEAEVREELSSFMPDAYSIVGREITIYEVEVGHHLNDAKLSLLANAWAYLDCMEWNLRLVVVNRFGAHSEASLCDEYHNRVDEQYMPKPPEPPPPVPVFKPTKRIPRNRKTFWWEQC